KERKFWWDELQHLFLQPGKLPEKLTLNIDDSSYSWNLGTAANYSQDEFQRDKGKIVWKSKPGTRQNFYYSVWQKVQCLPTKAQQSAMNQIRAWVGSQPCVSPDDRSLTPEEVRTLGEGGLATIGAHTVTHPSLKEHSPEFQLKEIQQSKDYLEKLLNHSVTTFAYPYGSYTSETARLVQQAGFECACSTVEKMVWQQSDSFELPRYTVYDWSGEEFAQRLDKWF
ncbi:MAG: polysaccharide deacetylase family protein, partial [Calothrix sp. SM1_7_51]|nr:polysaccharide deacetylase family protein [Calothrix sp. SM1_7_51]